MQIIEINTHNFSEVASIYREGIETGIATFEKTIPGWADWDKSHLPFGRIAAVLDNTIVGWAALSPVSSRCVYGGVAEVSIYVSAISRGKGVGAYLLQNLVSISEENNIWTLQSGVFRENTGSIALHIKFGFRIIGYKEKIGQLNGVWFDNILLERRSQIVGL